MKTIMRILLAVALSPLLLSVPAAQAQGATRISFTNHEVCDPGTFVWERAWLAGQVDQIRGITQTCYETASIPQMTGVAYLLDARLISVDDKPTFVLGGKIRIEAQDNCVWVGGWTWPAKSRNVQVVAHGDGTCQGMELHWSEDASGAGGGYILVTGPAG